VKAKADPDYMHMLMGTFDNPQMQVLVMSAEAVFTEDDLNASEFVEVLDTIREEYEGFYGIRPGCNRIRYEFDSPAVYPRS
jgi:hypothetical protein